MRPWGREAPPALYLRGNRLGAAVIYRIIFFDGDRQFMAFDWTLGVDTAITAAPDFMAICGATRGAIRDDQGVDVWVRDRA